ncbi:MAG: hypothetical protein ABI718_03695 [Acidobacteriota bacterium]
MLSFLLLTVAACSAEPTPTDTVAFRALLSDGPVLPDGKPVRPDNFITAAPNPVVVCDGSELGTTTISWSTKDHRDVEVRVGSPSGKTFSSGTAGEAATGKWVLNDLTFFLQDVTDEKLNRRSTTIASVSVAVTSDSCH